MPLQSLCSYLQLLTMPTPSLILVPARFKTGKLYTPLATTSGGVVLGASGDFNVTRATTATRFNSAGLIESVASGIPRLDYYTSGGTAGCPALLVEPAATNLALHSRDLTNAVWSGTTVTTAKNAVGADGVASGATTITATAASGTVLQALSHASQSRVFSAYIRRVTGTGAIQLTTNGGTNWTTVTISSLYTQVACTAQTVSNGSVGIRMAVSGDVIEVDFTQGEVGPVATSPMATTTAAVTRNVDEITVSDAVSGCIGQTEGTLYAEVDMRVIPQFIVPIAIDVGTVNEYLILAANSDGAFRVVIKKSTGSQTQLIISSSNPVGVYKLALAYKNGDYALSINGATPLTSSDSTNYPTGTFSRVHLSFQAYGVGLCRTRAAALYTTRLTNAQLQALTTL
jgi:hypothetical protein